MGAGTSATTKIQSPLPHTLEVQLPRIRAAFKNSLATLAKLSAKKSLTPALFGACARAEPAPAVESVTVSLLFSLSLSSSVRVSRARLYAFGRVAEEDAGGEGEGERAVFLLRRAEPARPRLLSSLPLALSLPLLSLPSSVRVSRTRLHALGRIAEEEAEEGEGGVFLPRRDGEPARPRSLSPWLSPLPPDVVG